MSLLILLLNIRKTLRLFSQGEAIEQDLDSLITAKRQEFLSKIAIKCIETCDDADQLEAHLSAHMILVDAMENFESIQNGRNIINWVLFESNPHVMTHLSQLLTDTTKKNYGQLPELLNHICATVRKIHGSTDGT
jgi:Mn-dependent DtxR family transcriptional regulator